MNQDSSTNLDHRAWQAFGVWLVFIIVVVLINGTIPFALGNDMRAWSFSTAKGFLFGLLIYGGLFLVAPVILAKGWRTVRQLIFFARARNRRQRDHTASDRARRARNRSTDDRVPALAIRSFGFERPSHHQ